MSDAKSTNLNIREDRPTGLSSSMQGSNLDAVGFNLIFLASRQPKLAAEIVKTYAKAHAVQPDDPKAPEEDIALFANEVAKLLSDKSVN